MDRRMILDATAGNRTMWLYKNCPDIIYTDIEKKLKNKPTIYADNTNTPFLPQTFDTIFYDPPHNWGGGDEPNPVYPSEIKKWAQKHKPFAFTYYGWDKYKTRVALMAHVYHAQKEFMRILKDDGLLWFKWNEMRIPVDRILACFTDWVQLLTLRVDDVSHTAGKGQTFWICFTKKREKTQQSTLLDCHFSENSPQSSL